MRKTILTQISTTAYNNVLINAAEWIGPMYSERMSDSNQKL